MKEYINLLKIYKQQDYLFYQSASHDRAAIDKYETNNNILDESILMEVELWIVDVIGHIQSISENNFSRIIEASKILEAKSIYNSKIIVNWLTEENIQTYPDFFRYLMFIENYRILALSFVYFLNSIK